MFLIIYVDDFKLAGKRTTSLKHGGVSWTEVSCLTNLLL
jgi:hypothetical protein